MPETAALLLMEHTVPAGTPPERLDRYAADTFSCLPSRKSAYRLSKRGLLRADGHAASPDYRVRPGMVLQLYSDDPTPPPPLELALPVHFQDEMLAVVEKPPGIPVSGNYARTVERALATVLVPAASLDALPWPRPVHRLDAPTGGLLLVAKTAAAMVALSRQFQTRQVHKRYRAIVIGHLDGKGSVDQPIDGRKALTRYQTVSTTHSLRTDWLTTVDAWPETGRTHQIRRHLASLGHPIVGDSTYGPRATTFRGKGLFLWAVELSFRHPAGDHPIRIAIDEPPKFTSYRQREERRWQRITSSE